MLTSKEDKASFFSKAKTELSDSNEYLNKFSMFRLINAKLLGQELHRPKRVISPKMMSLESPILLYLHSVNFK